MKQCETCCFWWPEAALPNATTETPYSEKNPTAVDLDHYALRDFSEDFGVCKCKRFEYNILQPLDLSGLIYWDYEGYSAHFVVGRRFGCVHHRERFRGKLWVTPIIHCFYTLPLEIPKPPSFVGWAIQVGDDESHVIATFPRYGFGDACDYADRLRATFEAYDSMGTMYASNTSLNLFRDEGCEEVLYGDWG